MKVLLTSDLNPESINGVAVSVNNLKKELEKNGLEVRLLTLSDTTKSRIKDNVYYISSMPFEVYPDIRASINFRHKYIEEMIRWKPDIIHSQCEFFTYTFVQRIAKKCHCPIVHTYHTQYEHYTGYVLPGDWEKLLARVMKIRLETADLVIAPSLKTRNYLMNQHIANNIRVIPTGIDLDRFNIKKNPDEERTIKRQLKIPEDAYIYGNVGRVAKEKNLDEVINIHKEILKINPRAFLLLVGGGADLERLKKLVSDKGLEESICFSGMVKPEQVASYYRLFKLFISASTSETQGLTYIEALANGKPVLARKDGAIDHVVKNGINGYQYESPKQAIDLLSKTMSDEELYEKLAKGAEESRQAFGTEIFGKRVIEVYKEVLARGIPPMSYKKRVSVRCFSYLKKWQEKTDAGSWLDLWKSKIKREAFRMEQKRKRKQEKS